MSAGNYGLNILCFLINLLSQLLNISLTYFTPVLHFIWKPVTWFAEQIKWLVSIWNATLSWHGLICFPWFQTFDLRKATTVYIVNEKDLVEFVLVTWPILLSPKTKQQRNKKKKHTKFVHKTCKDGFFGHYKSCFEKLNFYFFLNDCDHPKNLMKRFCEIFVFCIFWNKNTSFLKNPNSPFQPIFNACNQVQFQKNLMKRFRESFESDDVEPKSDQFTQFWAYVFSIKIKSNRFYPLILLLLKSSISEKSNERI